MTRCAGRAVVAAVCRSGWAGWGTGSARTPPVRTATSPAGSRCGRHPTSHRRLPHQPQERERQGERGHTVRPGRSKGTNHKSFLLKRKRKKRTNGGVWVKEPPPLQASPLPSLLFPSLAPIQIQINQPPIYPRGERKAERERERGTWACRSSNLSNPFVFPLSPLD